MKRLTQLTAMALCLTALAVQSASASPGKTRHGGTFEQFDADGNGSISRAEMEALGQGRMMEADANGDGALSLEELQAHAASRVATRTEKMMARMDKNGDGMLTGDELQIGKRAGRRFDRVDENGDGEISREEFDAARAHRAGHRKAVE